MRRPKQTKARAAAKARPDGTEAELRRWCIEQAIRWPTHGPYGSPQGAAANPWVSAMNNGPVESDVIGRAERLRKWVISSSVQ
jgi:hypothetical protein